MRLLLVLCAAALSATSSFGATIVVLPGTPAISPVLLKPDGSLLTGGRLRVGYFINHSSEQELRMALSTPGLVTYWMNTNFVPLGEPDAPVLLTLGGGVTPQLGTQSTVSFGPIGTTGYQGVTGAVSGTTVPLTFVTGAQPNTFTPAGVPRGSRLFLVAYPSQDISNAEETGIYSAETWLVPLSPVSPAASMVMVQVDSPQEIFRGSIGSFGPQPALMLPAVIPEPSGSALLFAGAMLLMRRLRIE